MIVCIALGLIFALVLLGFGEAKKDGFALPERLPEDVYFRWPYYAFWPPY